MKDPPRTPLRVVLHNFLNHIENLESQNSPDESYEKEFQDLKLFSENVKTLKEYSCQEGEKEVNRKKNRYKDILPFDLSRVVLNEYAGIPGSDYINANYIKGASGSPAYIASQGPLPSTVNDFWRMVVQCEVQVIVMACNEEEAGKAKCERYWVNDGEEKQFGMITVKLIKASTVCPDFSVRTMRLKYTNSQNIIEERTVCQLHYVAWPDHGVPTVVQPLLDMVRLVRDTQASETLPVLVHCSAGCGRTGTICAIDYVWGLLRTGKLTDEFSLLSLIRDMRKQRIAMVQTKEQYVLVHQAVRELFKEQLSMIDSHPYENVDPNGLLIIKEPENEYDTIENLTITDIEEKQDETMEKDVAPPLPKKKHTLFASKLEKEVENLSAQQRAAQNLPKIANGGDKIVRSSADKLLAPMIPMKKIAPKPIPSKGILRVPQLESVKSAGTVKRSKSLKVGQSGDKQRLVYSTDIPLDIKRRSSLESNVEEALSPLSRDASSKDEQIRPKTHLRKYEALATYSEDRKLFVRSYTTLEMRQKALQDAMSPKVVAQHQPVKVKLSRSNTQIDFARLASNAMAARRSQNDRHPKLGPQLRPLSVFPDPRSPDKRSHYPASIRPKPSETVLAFQNRTPRNIQFDGQVKDYLYGSIPPPPTTSYEGKPAIKAPPKVDYKKTPGSGYADRRVYPRSQNLYKTPLTDPKYVAGPGFFPMESTPPKTYPRYPSNYHQTPVSSKTTVKVFPHRPPVDTVDFASSSGSKPRPVASCKPFELNADWSQEQQKQSFPPSLDHGYSKRFNESPGHHLVPAKPSRDSPSKVVESVKKPVDYFTTAPGVDLDKVAASITQKDGSKNLMKAALEAFSMRKTKQQKPDTVTVKGATPAVGCSKKQQQYL